MERKHPGNLFVRDRITEALFKLMKSKDFNDITVSMLVKTAGVSRNSFYRNYQSMEDIIRQYLIERTSQWWAEYLAHLHPNVIEALFQHFLDMRETIQLLYHSNLSHLLMEHIVMCGRESLIGDAANAYQTAFMSGGLCGLTNAWIIRGMRETPKEMQSLFLAQRNQADKDP